MWLPLIRGWVLVLAGPEEAMINRSSGSYTTANFSSACNSESSPRNMQVGPTSSAWGGRACQFEFSADKLCLQPKTHVPTECAWFVKSAGPRTLSWALHINNPPTDISGLKIWQAGAPSFATTWCSSCFECGAGLEVLNFSATAPGVAKSVKKMSSDSGLLGYQISALVLPVCPGQLAFYACTFILLENCQWTFLVSAIQNLQVLD